MVFIPCKPYMNAYHVCIRYVCMSMHTICMHTICMYEQTMRPFPHCEQAGPRCGQSSSLAVSAQRPTRSPRSHGARRASARRWPSWTSAAAAASLRRLSSSALAPAPRCGRRVVQPSSPASPGGCRGPRPVRGWRLQLPTAAQLSTRLCMWHTAGWLIPSRSAKRGCHHRRAR